MLLYTNEEIVVVFIIIKMIRQKLRHKTDKTSTPN